MEIQEKLTYRERVERLVNAGCKGALSCALAASACMGALSLPQVAYAQTGAITIESVANKEAAYKVYKVFDADIAANDDAASNDRYPRIATHIEWAGESVKTAALAFLDENGYRDWLESSGHDGENAHDLPQNAAEYMAQSIGTSLDDENAAVPHTKRAKTFALELAKALASAGVDASGYKPYASGGAPQAFDGATGFYLFVTDDESVESNEAGTSPIWVPLGASAQTVREKAAVPTVDKQVKEGSSGEYGKAADAHKGQLLSYKLKGTLPDNYDAFDTYRYKFTDTFSAGLDLAVDDGEELADAVKVTIDASDGSKTDISKNSNVSIAYDEAKRVLEVDIADLKKVSNALDKNGVIYVEYGAKLNENALIGAQGNPNDVKLTYTSNPVSEATSTTLDGGKKVYGYTYQLSLNKLDKQTAEPLSGAKFTMRVAQTQGSKDDESVGKYVQGDGSLSQVAYEFTTEKGKLLVPRIDEGTYVLHEVAAPEGYDTAPDITLTIDSTLDQETGKLTKLDASVSGGITGATVSSDVVTHVEDSGDTLSTGTINVTTSDDKKITMPITGMDGATAVFVYGTIALVLGMGGWFASRRIREHGDE